MLKVLGFCFLQAVVGFNAIPNHISINRKSNLQPISMSVKPSDILKSLGNGRPGEDWSYNDLSQNILNHNIDSAVITDKNSIVFLDKNFEGIPTFDNVHIFKTLPDLTDKIVKQLIDNHINFDIFNTQTQSDGGFLSQIPIGIQIFFGYLIISSIFSFIAQRNMMGGPMNPLNQFKKDIDYVNPEDIDVSFADVAGCDETKYELQEIVEFLKNPVKYKESGATIPGGVLLEGEPGTGKTLLARAVAGEAGVSFISASGSQFIEMFVGVGASRIRKLFDKANEATPCVIFIDEIDAIGRQRGAGFNSGNDEREQTLNQLLTNMDGFDKSNGIIVMAATNRADILDSALLRPGRFDRKIGVPLPDSVGRKSILEVHCKGKKIDDNLELDEFVDLTSGFSGADLANMMNEAAILSVRYNNSNIDNKCLMDAFEKVTIGLPKLNPIENNEINQLVAYHEAGHTLVAKLFDDFFTVQKVTINANTNGAGGYTLFTSNDRYQSYPTKKYMLARLMVSLGGRAAEVLLYKNEKNKNNNNYDESKLFECIDNLEVTTGASNDLMQASELAKTYVSLFGVDDEFCLSGNNNPNQPFVGREIGLGGDKMSEMSKSKVDGEVERIVNFAYKQTIKILSKNREALSEIADGLLKENSVGKMFLDNLDISYN